MTMRLPRLHLLPLPTLLQPLPLPCPLTPLPAAVPPLSILN
jgi:hypothetical protein